MSRESDYRQAAANADARKNAFLASARTAKARITPARLKQDAKDKVIATVLDGTAYAGAKVQQRPAATAAAVSALAIFLMRRPIGKFLQRLYVRIRNDSEEISETDDG